MSVEEVAGAVAKLGKGALVAKMDIRQACCHVPITQVLGMQWHGKTFIDATLPFGLRPAPLIFTAIADAAIKRGHSNVPLHR